MKKNENVRVRALTEEEKLGIEKESFNFFAVYASFCPNCGYVDRTNMYLMRAKERINTLHNKDFSCPDCGKCCWEIGFPEGTSRGFIEYK